MYNRLLDTFIAVADCGSFTKASDRLYITPTAVMKQISSLEYQLGVKLLERGNRGITLTSAGEVIYKDSKFLIEYSAKSVERAKEAAEKVETTFCVGTSLLNPAKPFMDLWYKANREFLDYNIHLVPFEDDARGIVKEIEALGKKFDFLVGVCDSKTWLGIANFLQLGTYKKMIAVARNHPLADRKSLKVEDLHGYKLIMVKEGDSECNNRIRKDLTTNHPQIEIVDTEFFYDLDVFNKAAESDMCLLSVECWKDVHPGLVTIPVEWDYEIPYGLLYSLDAPKDVVAFVDSVRESQGK